MTSCCGHFGVIFNSNRELLRNYHAEKRFELHYYTCAGCYISLTVDNRVLEDSTRRMSSANASALSSSSSGASSARDSELTATPLERLIHTKWQEAKIALHGPAPPSMNF